MGDPSSRKNMSTLLFFLLIGLASLSAYLGYRNSEIVRQAEAVEGGHAEWYEEDGAKQWRWRECDTCVKVTE